MFFFLFWNFLARFRRTGVKKEKNEQKLLYIWLGDWIHIGPGYRFDSVFDLSKMQPYNLNDLIDLFLSLTDDVILYLPRTSDLRQLAARTHGGKDEKTTVIHYCMEGASKVCDLTPVIFCAIGERENETAF